MNDEIYMLKKTTKGCLVKLDPETFYSLIDYNISVGNRKGIPITTTCWKKDTTWDVEMPITLSHFVLNVRGVIIDHINRDILDNRRCNLRFVTKRQNNLNSKKRGRNTIFYGVIPSFEGNFKRFRSLFAVEKYKRANMSFEFNIIGLFLAAIAHDKLVCESGNEDYAPLNFQMFKIPKFKKVLLNTDVKLLRRKYVKRANSIYKTQRRKAHNPVH